MKNVTFPLDPLFELLENAGFKISPADRLRAWRVLEGIGRQTALEDPTRLRTLLAPVLARSAAEQRKFYEIFDRFLGEVKPTRKPAGRGFDWIGLVLGLASLAVLAVVGRSFFEKKEVAHPQPHFSVPYPPEGVFSPGETVRCFHTTDFSKNKKDEYEWSWRVQNEGTAVATAENTDTFTFVCPEPPLKDMPAISLTLRHKPTEHFQPALTVLKVACRSRPPMPIFKIPTTGKVGETLVFEVFMKKEEAEGFLQNDKKALEFKWDFSDKTPALGMRVSRKFENEGTFTIAFSLRDISQIGLCTRDTTFQIRIGTPTATLPFKPLTLDRIRPTLATGWLAWLLVGLLSGGAGFFWFHWSRRKPPADDALPPALAGWQGKNLDQGPYYIPFREQTGAIRPAREQYKFAEALRRRQEGEHRALDLRATLRATVARGGYPQLRFRYLTRPTDYLFLCDESLPGNHLARLFAHLAETLRGQDVSLDVFYCDAAFRVFRDPQRRQSLSLEELRRLFPRHRLIVAATGHAMLDARLGEGENAPGLRSDMLDSLQFWADRLLLTPLPPTAWTWREGALYRHFGLFPADLRGLMDAAAFVEGGLDREDLPPLFETWCERQIHPRRAEINPNYRRWRSAQDHADYLAPHPPELLRWLRALAVHPAPSWELTLAIGRALGIGIHHDRLLALARIPWLQDGQLHPRLRRELLAGLPENDEIAARRAVVRELEEVRHLTADSHAGAQLESHAAVQQFMLDPDDEAAQAAISGLLEAHLISAKQEDELNFGLQRHLEKQGKKPKTDPAATLQTPPADIREHLRSRLEPEPPQPKKRPFFTADFYRAATLTALAALLALACWRLERPERPGEWMRPQVERLLDRDSLFEPGRDRLEHWGLVREVWEVDSALIYNNLGVEVGDFSKFEKSSNRDFRRAATFFNKAIIYRAKSRPPDPMGMHPAYYPLALQNRIRNWFNEGAWHLSKHGSNRDSLRVALSVFKNAYGGGPIGFPREQTDARHGIGICHFYLENRDSAMLIYRDLLQTGYFDTLTLRPNLETLLGFDKTRILKVDARAEGQRINATVTWQLAKALPEMPLLTASAVDKSGKIVAFAQATLAQSAPGQHEHLLLLLPTEPGKAIRSDSLVVRLYADGARRRGLLAEWRGGFAFVWAPAPLPIPYQIFWKMVDEAIKVGPTRDVDDYKNYQILVRLAKKKDTATQDEICAEVRQLNDSRTIVNGIVEYAKVNFSCNAHTVTNGLRASESAELIKLHFFWFRLDDAISISQFEETTADLANLKILRILKDKKSTATVIEICAELKKLDTSRSAVRNLLEFANTNFACDIKPGESLITELTQEGICHLTTEGKPLTFRTRPLSLSEFVEIDNNPGGTLDKQTKLSNIPPGERVFVLDSTDRTYKVSYNSQVGYVSKFFSGRSTLFPCGSRKEEFIGKPDRSSGYHLVVAYENSRESAVETVGEYEKQFPDKRVWASREGGFDPFTVKIGSFSSHNEATEFHRNNKDQFPMVAVVKRN